MSVALKDDSIDEEDNDATSTTIPFCFLEQEDHDGPISLT